MRSARLKRLIEEQRADDTPEGRDDRIEPERKGDGRVANATDLGINLDRVACANWREGDERPRVRFLDDPAARWLGLAAEEAMYTGIKVGDGARVPFPCPICEGSRPPGVECGYCHREGAEARLPLRTMPTIKAIREARKSNLAQRRARKRDRQAVPA